MANITIKAQEYSYIKYTRTATGTATGSGPTDADAKSSADSAVSNASNWGDWSSQAQGKYDEQSRIGRYLGTASTTTGDPVYSIDSTSGVHRCSISYTKTQDSYGYQVHLKINTTGLKSSNIASATLKVVNSKKSDRQSYYILAPKDSNTSISNTTFYLYNDNSNLSSTKKSQDIENTNGKSATISIDITDVLKASINASRNNESYLIFTPSSIGYGTSYLKPSSYTIEYTLNITACTPPTSISDNGTGYIISGGSIKLKWSGATAGTNNAITGYRIYWKMDGNPTTSSYTGYYDHNSTTKNCTFSTATSGTFPNQREYTYYFKICTKGTTSVDSSVYSSLSSSTSSIKFNQLPSEPTVNSCSPERVKTIGDSNITFDINPGQDVVDTDQTMSIYYSLPPNYSSKQLLNKNKVITLTSSTAGVIRFYTYDGYEYSSDYAIYTVPLNTAPTCSIESITIDNSNYYDPYISEVTTNETCDSNGSIITKSWQIISNNTSTEVNNNNITNYYLLNNNGITFGSNYIIKYIVTDDVGETASAQWSSSFPLAPTCSINSNCIQSGEFGGFLQLDFDKDPSGLKEMGLFYKQVGSTDWSNFGLNIQEQDSVYKAFCIDDNTPERDENYYFKVRFTLQNNNTAEVSCGSDSYSRAPQLVIAKEQPTNLFINPFTGINITNFIFSVSNIISLDQLYGEGNKKAEIEFCYGNQSQSLGMVECAMEYNNIIPTITYDNIKTDEWQTLIGVGNKLNQKYNGKICVKVYNLFQESFSNYFDIEYDFSNSLSISELEGTLYIKDENENYQLLNENEYPLFESQELRINLSGLKSYCSETVKFVLYDHIGNTNYDIETTILLDKTEGGDRPIYTSNTNNNPDYIYFTIPSINTQIIDSNNKYNITYFTLEAINEANQIEEKESINIYETEKVQLCRCNINAIDFIITKIETAIENNNEVIKIYYDVNDFGGIGDSLHEDKYSTIYAKFYYSEDGNYTEQQVLISENLINQTSPCVINLQGISLGEKVFFKTEIIVTNNFKLINNQIPYGTTTYNTNYQNSQEFTFYNKIPNLAYGKNYFLINTTKDCNLEDQILLIGLTGYMKEQQPKTRNKIYFANTERITDINDLSYIELTSNGLIINGGTWDSNSV